MRYFILLLILVTSCSYKSQWCPVSGCDEFVLDSYRIRQGKVAVLEMMGECAGELPQDAMEEYQDSIAEDDILNIALFHPSRTELREGFDYINTTVGGFRVSRGMVQIPDLPPIYVAGLTLKEAQERLVNEIKRHYQDAGIFLSYKNRLNRKVDLLGNVGVASIPVDGKIRLYEVLCNAHLRPDANLFMSYVIREGKPLPIDLYKLMNEGDMSQNIVMRGGDKIFIANPADSIVTVMGEVNNPCVVPLPYGFIPLSEALVKAHGIPFTGDITHIQVIRSQTKCPKMYVVSLEHVLHLPARSMLLMPGDVVYVSATLLTHWNRFIGQLTPSIYGIRDTCSTYQGFGD